MTLSLTVISYAGRTPATPVAVTFGEDGGVVGRQPGCDWVLEDPEGHVSKRHCRIDFVSGRYRVTDTSTNGVFLNDTGSKIGFGASALLNDGDHLYMGSYDIAVHVALPGSTLRNTAEDDDPFGIGNYRKPVEDTPPPLGGSYFDAAPLTSEPADKLPDSDDWLRLPTPDHAPIDQLAFQPPRAAPPRAAPSASGNGSMPSSGLLPSGWNPLDDDDGLEPPPRRPAPAVVLPQRVEPIVAPPRPPVSGMAAPLMADRPDSAPTEQPTATESSAPRIVRGVSGDSSTMDLVQAFLEGAGLGTELLDQAEPEAVLHAAGQRLRELVSGMRTLLEVRNKIKSQLRVEQTQISAADNNPLKLSVNDEDALMALLLPPRQGYLPADAAIRRSFQDLKAHELALMAGARNAVAEALAPLAPETLMRRVEGRSLLAASRKAKYWDLFEAEFNRLREAGEDDPHGQLARTLARAYEDQERKQ
jgi:type VI secretion system protein